MATRLSSTRTHVPDKDEPEELPNTEVITSSFPTDSQIAQARLLVLEQEAIHSRFQEEYEKQKATMTEIEGRLRTAADTLFKTRAVLAGIRRLPLEILGEIFVNHVRGNFGSPWTVMHVCRAWRNAALLTRTIWGVIMLTPALGPKFDKNRSRIFKGMELCFKPSQVFRALARAGPMPLDLSIGFEVQGKQPSGQKAWRDKQHGMIDDMLETLIFGVEKRRIRSFEVNTGGQARLWFNLWSKFDTSGLESLRLDRSYPIFIEQVLKEAKRLRRLTANAKDIKAFADVPWLGQLEELGILDAKHVPLDSGYLHDILHSARSLQFLSIHGGLIMDNRAMERSIDMPGLTHLELRGLTCFWPIECPNLTHLTIECDHRSPRRIEPNSIHLPHLKVFNFTCCYSLECLLGFVVPNLREFDLHGSPSKSDMRRGMSLVWSKKSVPNINPTIFRFHHATVNCKVIADTIKTMSQLEEVKIQQVNVNTQFLNELHPKSISPPKKKQPAKKVSRRMVSASKMKVLSIDFIGSKAKTEGADAYEKAATELLEKRQHAKAPLERIEVRLTEEDGWRVFENE